SRGLCSQFGGLLRVAGSLFPLWPHGVRTPTLTLLGYRPRSPAREAFPYPVWYSWNHLTHRDRSIARSSSASSKRLPNSRSLAVLAEDGASKNSSLIEYG